MIFVYTHLLQIVGLKYKVQLILPINAHLLSKEAF